MFYRLYQFWSSLFPKITAQEQQYIATTLSKEELEIFNRLPKSDRQHCVRIALYLKVKDNQDILLQRAGLLHDIGKIYRPLNIFEKSLAVVLDKLLPNWAQALSEKNNSFMDTYYNHPKKGAEIALQLELEEELVFLIKNHHNRAIKNSRLQNLIAADNLY